MMSSFRIKHINSLVDFQVKDTPREHVPLDRGFVVPREHVPLDDKRWLPGIARQFLLTSLLFTIMLTPLVSQTDSLRSPDIEMDQARETAVPDTAIGIENDPWQPDPKKALWFSLALPGLGQIYNGSWWKTPIIYGGLGVSVWFIRENNQNYKAFRTAYSESFNPDTDNELVKRYPNQESLRRARDIYYKWYQLSIIATAAVYLMNGIEAYVDAHLKNFEISDDLSLQYGFPDTKGTQLTPPLIHTPTTYSIIGVSYRLH